MGYRDKVRNADGTGYKTLKNQKPSSGRSGEERASRGAASDQGVPHSVPFPGFTRGTHHYGNTDLAARMAEYANINRVDTPEDVLSGGPVIMNKGEHMFTIYPRRVDQGRTIRTNEESSHELPQARKPCGNERIGRSV